MYRIIQNRFGNRMKLTQFICLFFMVCVCVRGFFLRLIERSKLNDQ